MFGHTPGKYDRTLQANSSPFGSSILMENVVVEYGNLRILVAFLSQDSDTARTSGLADCAKAVSKTNLGRRLQMLTCMKAMLFRLQKSTNESAWGHTWPGLASTSPEKQRRSRMRVRLKASKTGRLLRYKRSRFLGVVE